MKKTFVLTLLLVGCAFLFGEIARGATVTFPTTGNYQVFTVPVGVTNISFDLLGASGGGCAPPYSASGGRGAHVTGSLTVTTGQVLYLFVGGKGSDGWNTASTISGGYNGGGSTVNQSGGGGGATDIRIGGLNLSNRVAVAGGGGGTGMGWNGGNADGGNISTTLGYGANTSQYGGGGGGYYGGYAGSPYSFGTGYIPNGGYGGSSWVNENVTSSTVSTASSSGDGVITFTYTPIPLLTWRNTNFSTVANTGDSADSFDFDGDGIQNLAEYALDGDPKVPDAAAIAPVIGASGNQVQISFKCDTAKSDVSYIVQASPDLSSGSWVDIAKSTGGAKTQEISSTVLDTGTGARLVTVTDSTAIPAGGKRFLRVKIVNPAL